MERKNNISEIKRLLQQRMEEKRGTSQLTRFLHSLGIAGGLAEEIVKMVTNGPRDAKLQLLKEALATRVKTLAGFSLGEAPKSVALVGSTGVGKTTMILKLADYYRASKRVALVSLDQEKGGAWAQLEKVASRWDIPLFSSYPQTPYDLVLVDTSGCNIYETASVEGLAKVLSHIPHVEIHLTVSASAKEVDLYGAVHQFSSLPLTSMIVTKWDETLAPGAVITLSSRVDIPISFVAYGYPLPGHIEPADPHAIAHKILTGLNGEEFRFLRGLATS